MPIVLGLNRLAFGENQGYGSHINVPVFFLQCTQQVISYILVAIRIYGSRIRIQAFFSSIWLFDSAVRRGASSKWFCILFSAVHWTGQTNVVQQHFLRHSASLVIIQMRRVYVLYCCNICWVLQ